MKCVMNMTESGGGYRSPTGSVLAERLLPAPEIMSRSLATHWSIIESIVNLSGIQNQIQWATDWQIALETSSLHSHVVSLVMYAYADDRRGRALSSELTSEHWAPSNRLRPVGEWRQWLLAN